MSKRASGTLPLALKQSLTQQAEQLIAEAFRPGLAQQAEAARQHGFNYVDDLYTAWQGKYFYFCARYCTSRADAVQEHFEVRSPRLEYVGDDRFNLAYQRHNGRWCEVYHGLTVAEALSTIRDEELFSPAP